MSTTPLHPLRPDVEAPDIETDQLVQLLDAEIILDQVRDTPHMHIPEALARGIEQLSPVSTRRRTSTG